MALLYLELAALAAATVPGLDVVEATEYTTHRHGDFDAAVVKTVEGRLLIVRRPRSRAAARQLAADNVALGAMTAGVRSRLPFAVPTVVGTLHERGMSVTVTEFIPGENVDRVGLEPVTMLVAEIGRAIAAIHSLPRGFVEDAGLLVLSSDDVRASARSVVERAARTGRLPVSVQRRWRDAIADASLWQFQPCVTHGALELGKLLTNGLAVVGVLDWSDLRVGDPARDMHWLHDLDPRIARGVLDEYAESIGGADRQLHRRAALHAELEIARWLLHGVESQNDAIVADAESTLAALVDRVHLAKAEPLVHETLPVLDLAEVQALLRDAGHEIAARHDEAPGRPGAAVNSDARGASGPPASSEARPGGAGDAPTDAAAEPGARPHYVQTGIVHGLRAEAHPDDDDRADLDHADDDDLYDDTPPSDFLRDGERAHTGEVLGVDDRDER